jgi:elongation factor Ts
MATITAEMVRRLRDETDAPMMKCKQALVEAEGDLDKARDIIRIQTGKAAQKRAGRDAGEGVVDAYVSQSGSVGVLIELNCETDFVARNEDFKNLAHVLARQVGDAPAADTYTSVDSLLNGIATGEGVEGKKIADIVIDAIGRIGEKIEIGRFVRLDAGENGVIGTYIHRTDSKTGTIVSVVSDKPIDSYEPLTIVAKEIAMHVAATKPVYLSKSEVPVEHIEHEREIARGKQANDPSFASKPEAAKKAMIEGQVRKFLEEKVLLEQGFVRDPSGKQKISALLDAAAKQANAGLKVTAFSRFHVGEAKGEQNADA